MLKEMLASLKDAILEYIKHRLFPVTVLIIVLFCILARRLFVLQIVEGEEHVENSIYKSEKTLTIDSVRGNIYDVNGKLLAYNELSYSVVFANDPALTALAAKRGIDENILKDEILKDTIRILEKNGDKLTFDFPIEVKNGKYQYTVSENSKKSFLKDVYSSMDFDSLSDDEKNSTAEDVMNFLCGEDMFEIPEDYDMELKYKVCACRYKLWMNRYQQYMPVSIAYDISDKSNAALTERSDELPGISVSVKSLRRYNDATYFAHIIGYIGPISQEELEEYNEKLPDDQKYAGSEMVGKLGVERYCESELRGTSGSETMYVDNLGKVIEKISVRSATAGNDIYLTIDSDLQKYCYDMLEQEIIAILLKNLSPGTMEQKTENASIPITDVYFALFDNNYIKMKEMGEPDATELEKSVYKSFTETQSSVLKRLDDILNREHTVLELLDDDYKEYMEYIVRYLVNKNILDNSKIDREGDEFYNYTHDKTALYDYLMYCISCEAIDISKIADNVDYYDNDEIYRHLTDYVLKGLEKDEEFSKLVIELMVRGGIIGGSDVVNLLYDQGVLNKENDADYELFSADGIGAYEFIRRKLQNRGITPAMLALKPCSGSIVVTDAQTGDVRAMVSYPSYDNNRLTNEIDGEYYDQLLNDRTSPMVNRATQVETAPGSTYKVLSSIAGLSEGVVSPDDYYLCAGEFDLIEPSAWCWNTYGHGGMNDELAIQNSCNVYFYHVGYNLAMDNGYYNDAYGLQRLEKYADEFGFGDLSGVEVDEYAPQVSDSDAVRSAIGQGHNLFAPIHLARYTTTVANSGTCYYLTLIDKVTDYEGKLVRDNSARVSNQVTNVSQLTWDTVHYGMKRVIDYNTTGLITRLNVAVAGKSGTAQQSQTEPDHALFISYAPYDNPEVTVTTVIQNGYNSGNTIELAGFVYAYIFDRDALVGQKMGASLEVSD